MDTGPAEFSVSVAEVVKAILAGLGTIAIWILKKIGDKHIASLDRLESNQELILKEVSGLATRVAVVETKCVMKHKDE